MFRYKGRNVSNESLRRHFSTFHWRIATTLFLLYEEELGTRIPWYTVGLFPPGLEELIRANNIISQVFHAFVRRCIVVFPNSGCVTRVLFDVYAPRCHFYFLRTRRKVLRCELVLQSLLYAFFVLAKRVNLVPLHRIKNLFGWRYITSSSFICAYDKIAWYQVCKNLWNFFVAQIREKDF